MNNTTPKYPEKAQKSPKKAVQYITERIKIEKLIPGGQGLGTLADGKKIFLWNALPGEIVTECLLTKNKSHYVEGIATKVENSAPERIAPRDECYLSTSPWQIMNYDYELQQKAELLREIFRQHDISLSDFNLTVQTDGHDFHYRNKMEYALYFDHADEKIHLAFHARGSHRKIPVTQSSIERSEIFAAANKIVDQLNAEKAEARDFQSLLLRCNQNGEMGGGLYRNHQPHPKFPELHDTLLGREYSYSPNGFFQINLPVYEMALKEIAKWIQTERVLDLYAGVGTIGLSVARDKKLTLVECDKAAYQEMERNCTGLANAQPVLARSEDVLSYIAPDQTVILDPPRAGCDAQLVEKLLEVQPTSIIYLSCNPATQARDVKALLEKYKIAQVVPFNFFPRTPHLENLVILEQK